MSNKNERKLKAICPYLKKLEPEIFGAFCYCKKECLTDDSIGLHRKNCEIYAKKEGEEYG